MKVLIKSLFIMNYKIVCHLMPWELDYALLSFTQLQKAKHYINDDDAIFVDVTLNLSDYIFDWSTSKISKDFFIDKFTHLQHLLDEYVCRFSVYEDTQLFGGLDTVRAACEDHIDHYMILNPDMYFGEKSIYYLIESSKSVHNKYFVITQQLPRLWDSSWDEISHENYSNIEHLKWDTIGITNVRHFNENKTNPELVIINTPKWAGWMDLYSKHMWEDVWAYHEDWKGYGACDYYTMQIANYMKLHGIDFQQYMLKDQLVYPYYANKHSIDYHTYYKNQLTLKDIPNQRDSFDRKMADYLTKGIKHILKINNKQI